MSTENPNWSDVIDIVSREKGIPREVFIEALEEAILKAAKKVFGEERTLEAAFNEETGQVELFQYMVVTDEVAMPMTDLSIEAAHLVDPEARPGDELGFQIFYLEADRDQAREEDQKYGDILNLQTYRRAFGRIAAQMAKHVVLQKVQEAERTIIFNEYKDRLTDLVTGVARRFEKGNVIVDLGKAEAILPFREQCPRESYRPGDRVQAFVKDVNRESKGHQIVLSRTDPRFVVKLFEKEVPEIYEGIVKINAVAREPGERTKLAVTSTDSDVDPVGACVGMKGSRVQAVVQELRGEKIDIIPYSLDLAQYVCAAIAPASVSRVLIDENNRQIELVVAEDQLSLAIGRRGQNVKLASKLLEWAIEIHGEARIEELKTRLKEVLVNIDGLDESMVEYLFKLGYHSPDNMLNADESELGGIPQMNMDIAQAIQQASYELKLTMREEALAKAQAEAEAVAAGVVAEPEPEAEGEASTEEERSQPEPGATVETESEEGPSEEGTEASVESTEPSDVPADGETEAVVEEPTTAAATPEPESETGTVGAEPGGET